MSARTASRSARLLVVLAAAAALLAVAGAAQAEPSCAPGPYANCAGVNLNGIDLSGRDLHGIILTAAELQGANLNGADLRSARLQGADLMAATLIGADLRSARLKWANFNIAKLNRANLTGASVYEASFDDADLSHVTWRNSLINNVNVNGSRMTGADLTGSVLVRMDFGNVSARGIVLRNVRFGNNTSNCAVYNSDFRGADLRGTRSTMRPQIPTAENDFGQAQSQGWGWCTVNLVGADLRGAWLQGEFRAVRMAKVDLRGARLARCSFSQVSSGGVKVSRTTRLPGDLSTTQQRIVVIRGYLVGSNMDLAGADLHGIDLTRWKRFYGWSVGLDDANLEGANLRGATIRDVSLSRANLRNANLSQADLTLGDLGGAKIAGTNFAGAYAGGAGFSNTVPTRKTNFAGAVLANTSWTNADFRRAPIAQLDFTGWGLAYANFRGVDLRSATTISAANYLYNVDFSGANLAGLDFTSYTYSWGFNNANFSGANLTGVTFSSVPMYNALFARANLTGANLAAVSNLDSTSFLGATTTGATGPGAGVWANARCMDGTFLGPSPAAGCF